MVASQPTNPGLWVVVHLSMVGICRYGTRIRRFPHSNMPRLALVGGVGATGTTMAQFFHPSAKIREKWPQHDKCRLFGVLVTGKGVRKVQHKNQMCYLVHIPEINDSTIFHIVKKNFKVLSAPATSFESKVPAVRENCPPAPVIPDEALNPDRIADRDVVPNIEGLAN